MLSIIAILFGILFIFFGVAGFLPIFTQFDLLFGIFAVNTLHNIMYLISGVLAIMAATRHRAVKFFFIVFGFFYTIIAIIGFWRNGDLFFIQTNMADNILHIVVGVIFLYLGLYRNKRA